MVDGRTRVAVTGASGYLGINLVLALVEAGYHVTAIDRVRSVSLPDGSSWVEADALDQRRMREAFEGIEIVYHLAAVITLASRNDLAWRVNTDGVEATARAALEAGVRRFVHCSSVHAFDERHPLIDESAPRATDLDLPIYDRSKWAGEERLRRVIDDGLDAVICNPTGIYGPRDVGPTRINAVLLAAARGRLPAAVAGGFDFVDVRDVASALPVAAQLGRRGENYLLGGHRKSVIELCRLAAAAGGHRPPLFAAPLWVMRGVAPLANPIAHLFGSDALSRGSLAALAAMPRVDYGKARRELGYAPRPAETTVADLVEFFAETGRARAPHLARRVMLRGTSPEP